MTSLYRNPSALRRGGRGLMAGLSLSLSALCFASTALCEPLTFNDALTRARNYDPSQRAAKARVEAATANARQAGAGPNATLGIDAENLGGSGPYSGMNRSETTLYYQQTLERGGKRQARTKLARYDISLAELRQTISQLDLFERVETLMVEALAADAEVSLAKESLQIARQAHDDVMRRVKAARDPLFAGSQVEADMARAQITLDAAIIKATEARQMLAAFWGGAPDFELDRTSFETLSLTEVGIPPETTADIAIMSVERDSAEARIKLEQARTSQDVSLKAGVRYFADGRDAALVVGGSIPLGRTVVNKSHIDRARAESTAAQADMQSARLDTLRQRARLISRLNANAEERRRIDAEVLPLALKSLDQVREGYARGGFRHSDIIDAAKAIELIKARRIEVTKSFYLDLAALNRLDGRHSGLVKITDIQP